MSDRPPNDGERNFPLFSPDDKSRQALTQAASTLFPVASMFPGALPTQMALNPLNQSFAAAFQQMAQFSSLQNNLPAFPAGTSLFNQTLLKNGPPQQRLHQVSSSSPGIQVRQAGQPSSAPTVLVKQQQQAGASSSISSSKPSTPRLLQAGEKPRVQTGDPPVVIAAGPGSSSGNVKLVTPSSFHGNLQVTSSTPMPPFTATTASGQPRLVAIQHSEAGKTTVTASGSSRVNNGSTPGGRTPISTQHISASPIIPTVKISAANAESQTSQSLNLCKVSRSDGRSEGQHSSYQTQVGASQMPNSAPVKTYPVTPAATRASWQNVVHTNFSRPAVPVGGNGQAIITDPDLAGGQHNLSSRPGILRKRPAGEGNNNVTGNMPSVLPSQSPRKITRLPTGIGVTSPNTSHVFLPSTLSHSQPISVVPGSNMVNSNSEQVARGSPGFASTALIRDTSTSSASSQPGVKIETIDVQATEPSARKKPRKQQLLPRSAPDNLMANFDPVNTISQLPPVVSSSHNRSQKQGMSALSQGGSSSGISSVSSQTASGLNEIVLKEEQENSMSPEPSLTEDEQKMLKLAMGELQEFVDKDGVRWFSWRSSDCSNKTQPKSLHNHAQKLLSSYRCSWRVRNNHFERHSDVRAKDERTQALTEFCVSARSHIPKEAAGWRLVQFVNLIEEQMTAENDTEDKITCFIEDCRGIDGLLTTASSFGQQADSHTNSSSLNGSSGKRGRGHHRLSGGPGRQSARTRQQYQQQSNSLNSNSSHTPFEYTQLPDMVVELNRKLKQVSAKIESLFSAHVPIAHQLLDQYAPVKAPKLRTHSSTSRSSSYSSTMNSASSSPDGEDTSSSSPNAQRTDVAEENLEKETEECLEAVLDSVARKISEDSTPMEITAEIPSIS